MRKSAVLVVLGVAALALPSTAAAAPTDFATGAAKFGTGPAGGQFELSAHQISGIDAKGQVSFQPNGFPRQRADVNCLRVDGNKAVVGAALREGSSFREEFNLQGITLFIGDNGSPGHGMPDTFNTALSPSAEGLCDLAPQGDFTPITSGNLVVEDATP